MSIETPEILLIGDLVRHVLLKPDGDEGRFVGYVREATDPLLPGMIEEALRDSPPKTPSGSPVASPEPPCRFRPRFDSLDPSTAPTLSRFGELHSVVDSFESRSSGEGADPKVLRIKSTQVASKTEPSVGRSSPPRSDGIDYLPWLVDQLDCSGKETSLAPGSVAVFYDHNSRFRDVLDTERKDEQARRIRKVVASASGLVLAINDAITTHWLESVCALLLGHDPAGGSSEGGPARHRRVVIVAADALRKSGLTIMELGALETSVNDVVSYLGREPLSVLEKHFDHIVVVFRETGALHIDRAAERASLTYAPNFDRTAQMNPAKFGHVPGKLPIFLAAIVRDLVKDTTRKDGPWKLDAALRLAVAAYNLHFANGLTANADLKIANPLDAITMALSVGRREELEKRTTELKKPEFLLSTLRFDLDEARARSWHRYDVHFEHCSTCGKVNESAQDGRLFDLVKMGLAVFRDTKCELPDGPPWCPPERITVPYTEFGKLRMVDYEEIEKYHSVAKIIDKYLKTPKWGTPLSLAVFGFPGSGKSYAVKQVLRAVSPERKTEPLTFNMAQFGSVEQLTEAFHKIQDRALASAEVPLVVFDEFDCSFGDSLGWLKYFLAPMQDGLFRGKSDDYRIGRSILVFSGGMASSLSVFQKSLPDEQAQKAAKLPDFLSRLRGYLDVGGINPAPEEAGIPLSVRLRRAILLRSLLEDYAGAIIKTNSAGQRVAQIDESLIRAFLRAPRYIHGVRSMEAIIAMSRLLNDRLVPASLPKDDQLAIHLAQPFMQTAAATSPRKH